MLLGTIGLVSPQQLPVVIYELSLITLAAVLDYWLDRSLFPKARPGQVRTGKHSFWWQFFGSTTVAELLWCGVFFSQASAA